MVCAREIELICQSFQREAMLPGCRGGGNRLATKALVFFRRRSESHWGGTGARRPCRRSEMSEGGRRSRAVSHSWFRERDGSSARPYIASLRSLIE